MIKQAEQKVKTETDEYAIYSTPQAFVPEWPLKLAVSGLYVWKNQVVLNNIPIPETPSAPLYHPEMPIQPPIGGFSITTASEELRLDVDRRYPLMVVSGTRFFFFKERVHWIANLTPANTHGWTGEVWYVYGNRNYFPYTRVDIVPINMTPAYSGVKVTFSGSGPTLIRTFKLASTYFHPIEFEYDWAQGTTPVTSYNTGSHSNRPATLPVEDLTIEDVYRRAGFDVTISPNGNEVPLVGAGANGRWSDAELHDAMQTYWSRFANKPQWAAWVFFASLHEAGTSLGGIMFDDIGPNHRQGTAIFEDSFIKNSPANDPAPTAWVQRMRFWTAVHEIGHTFNLAHSWRESLPVSWIPLVDEPEACTIMNYPYRVRNGETAFFSDFEYRFTDHELLFLRHAPAAFVQQGNASWFDDHGFEQADVSPQSTLKLVLRANRTQPTFEFMEPVNLELKLTNISDQIQLVAVNLLTASDNMVVIIKKKDKEARQYIPYAECCVKSGPTVLNPAESLYASLSPYAGLNGMDMIDPGYYTVQVAIHTANEDLISNPLDLRITPPKNFTEEVIAQDYDSYEVGRILSFGGSMVLQNGNQVLHEIVSKLPDRRVAIHASMALAHPLQINFKSLEIAGDSMRGAKIRGKEMDIKGAKSLMNKTVLAQMNTASESIGHIDFKHTVDRFSRVVAEHGDVETAVTTQTELLKTFTTQKVKDTILTQVKDTRDQYRAQLKK